MAHLQFPNKRTLSLDQPRIMGILNVTPDSFSDGGEWLDRDAAVAHGLAMAAMGADVIDVGGESTRPGAERVPAAEQIRRVIGVIEHLRQGLDEHYPDVAISIDTTIAGVAAAAIDAGATMCNDVAAGGEDSDMFELVAARGVPVVLMHMGGHPATMQESPQYDNVVAEVKSFLVERAQAAIESGIRSQQLLIDPGIGFGKTKDHNLALLANLNEFVATGLAVLIGTSRKRFMGAICRRPAGLIQHKDAEPNPPLAPPETSDTPSLPVPPESSPEPAPHERVGATCATTALGVAAGAVMFRVHDVQANRQAVDIAWAVTRASRP